MPSGRSGRRALRAQLVRAVDRLPDARLTRLVAVRPLRGVLLRRLADAVGDGRLGAEPVRLRLVLLAEDRRLTYLVEAEGGRARVRWSTDAAPLEVELAVADAVRIGLGRLDAGTVLLDRRLEVRGDLALAFRLTEAFEGPDPED